MSPAFRAKLLFTVCLALGGLFQATPVQAQSTRDQVRMIEQEYARSHDGRTISDAQLEYYLDRMDAGWSMSRISADMAASASWQPATGWVAREVICSSIGSRYAECRVPFRGTAMITQQLSNSTCIEGRSWGNKPGVVWVDNGCRARFGIVANSGPLPPARTVNCNSYRSRYRECATGFRGQVYLARQAPESNRCIEGRTWGQRPGVVWVRGNCRATFSSALRPVPGNDMSNGTWTRRPNYAVTCVARESGRTVCTWDDRYGTPRIIQQISSSACVEGEDWGYTRGGGIWVTDGCRATFGYGNDYEPYRNYGYRDWRDTTPSSTTWVRDPNYGVTCASADGRRTVCAWDSRYGNPTLVQPMSGSCVEGRDWGYDRNGELWVTSGCRARFGYGNGQYSRPEATWTRDPNYGVTCASVGGQRTMCTWDTRYGNPYIVEQISSSQCIEGRDWGYDTNGNIWVNSGCRARFGYR